MLKQRCAFLSTSDILSSIDPETSSHSAANWRRLLLGRVADRGCEHAACPTRGKLRSSFAMLIGDRPMPEELISAWARNLERPILFMSIA